MEIRGASGLVCEASKFRGREIQAIADKLEEGRSMSDQAMCSLLSSCWSQTIDSGPYDLDDGKPNFYNQILKGDIPSLLLCLRVGSFKEGTNYGFKVRCEDADCREPIPWHIDISKDVLSRIKPLSDEGQEHLRSKEPIEVVTLDGTRVGFQLMTLSREEPMRKFVKQQRKRKQRRTRDGLLQDRIASQILTIDGNRVSNVRDRWEWASDLTGEELYHLRDMFDAHDCEVDTTITVRCHECGWEFDAPLPFGRSFLDPTSQSRRDRLFGPVKDQQESMDQKAD